ncbi:unnamed protein product [Owenia fusiformis]|uniref:Uncharacterized protein n=1 Tax=Owenia fusiformis TaxID=6347 RepID=A0A8J1U294_OWEFU|nr:unnamed protein product [Owenia fusiformis]
MSAPMKSVVDQILNNISENNGNPLELVNLISCSREFSIFQDASNSSMRELVSHVNTWLNSSQFRVQGLGILYHILQDCSAQVITDYGLTWMALLTQALQSYDPAPTHKAACVAMRHLLKHTINHPELARQISTTHLPSLLNTLLAAKPHWLEGALLCTRACIQFYHGACGPFKSKIETFAVSHLEHSDAAVSKAAILCYSVVPMCGGGGNQGIKHTESWAKHLDKLLGTMNDILDNLYDGLESGDFTYFVPKDRLNLLPLKTDHVEKVHQLSDQFGIVAKCIAQLLRTDYPSLVNLPLEELLGIVCRTLAITGTFLLSRPSSERVTLVTVLPNVHQEALKLLEQLIPTIEGHLVPHTYTVNQLLKQSLAWTKTGDQQTRLYSSLRSQIYQTLSMWEKTLRASSNSQKIAESIVENVISDARIPKDILKLNETTETDYSEPLNKKQRRKGKGSSGMAQGNPSKLMGISKGSSKLCSDSLAALKWLLTTVGHELKPATQKAVQEFLIPLILEIQQNPQALPHPYSDSQCRHLVYDCLLATVVVPCPKWPPPTQCAMQIFKQGLLDKNTLVSSFCQTALTQCTSIIHPRAPTLLSPLSLADLPTELRISQKTTNQDSETISHDLTLGKNPAEKAAENMNVEMPSTSNEDDSNEINPPSDISDVHPVESNDSNTEDQKESDDDSDMVNEESDMDNDDSDGNNVKSDKNNDDTDRYNDDKDDTIDDQPENLNENKIRGEDPEVITETDISKGEFVKEGASQIHKDEEVDKLTVEDVSSVKKADSDLADEMLMDFVDASPDSD